MVVHLKCKELIGLNKRILIIGASGFLGAFCYQILTEKGTNEIIGTFGQSKISSQYIQIDLTSAISVKNIMIEMNPDVVIWCAKHSSPKFDELELNEVGLRTLIETSRPNMRLIFLSTDGVLPGINGVYKETTRPLPMMSESPVAQYTNAKLEAERFIMSSIENYCILRVGPIYGRYINGIWDQRIAAILDSLERKNTITRATNIFRTFIHVQDLASAICELTEKDIQGIFHLGPNKSESYFEFSLEVARAFGYNTDLIIPSEVSYAEAQSRHIRMNTTMDTSKANEFLSTSFQTVREVLNL